MRPLNHPVDRRLPRSAQSQPRFSANPFALGLALVVLAGRPRLEKT